MSATKDVIGLLRSPRVLGPAGRGHNDYTVTDLVLGRVALDFCNSANTISSQNRAEHDALNKTVATTTTNV